MTLIERLFPKQSEKIKNEAANIVANQARGELSKIMAAMPGAYGSWSRSAGAKYAGGNSTNFAGITFNHWQLRQQARDAYHDSVQARAMVDRFADTVVDSGLVVEPEPNYIALGITQEEAQEWRDKNRAAFHHWCNSKQSHRAGVLNFYQAQRLLSIYDERDNDTFVRLYYNPDSKLLNPLQFEVIDTNQIRGDAITSTLLVGRFADGIDRDAAGNEKSYKIWVQLSDSTPGFESVDVPRYGKSGLPLMLHGFVPSYAGQGRGLSGLGAVLQEFEFLTDLNVATVQKAINHASINLWVKPSQNAPASNPLDSIGNMGQGVSSIVAGAPGAISGVGSAAMTQNPTVNYTPIEEGTIKQPGINVFNLDMGEELRAFDSTTPAVGYAEFFDSFCSYLCAARGMPLEILLMKFNSNYSAARSAILLFWRVACMKRDFLDSNFIAPIYEAWLCGEIAAGRTSCPGWNDPRIRAEWTAHRINGTPMPNIDPSKSAKADELLVTMGAKTLDDVARETNGSSGKSNRIALMGQFSELSAAGKAPWVVGQAPQVQEEEDKEEEEDEDGKGGKE